MYKSEDNNMLDDIFGGNEIPKTEVYKMVQKVIKTYMDKTNKKIDYVAEELGTTQGYLRKQIDPHQPERPLSIDRIIDITKLTGDVRILQEIANELDMVVIPRKQAIAKADAQAAEIIEKARRDTTAAKEELLAHYEA
jgi:hypothetical protein